MVAGSTGRQMGAFVALLLLVALTGWIAARYMVPRTTPVLLDGFDNVSAWSLYHSDDVCASLRAEHGALCIDFDFNGVAGFVSLRRELPISFSGNFALSLRLRGESPENTLQLKLIDATGDNVWWVNQPGFAFTGAWQTVRAERRQIDFAWGPAKDHSLRRTAAVEIALATGKGGCGQVCFDSLELEPLPSPRTTWPQAVVRASSALPGASADHVLDGSGRSAWRSDPLQGTRQSLDIDFLIPRAFGGLVLHWLPGLEATRYAVQFSEDDLHWRTVRSVTGGNGGEDPLLLTESHTRFVRLALEDGPAHAYGLSEIEVKDLAWGASPNTFFENLAKSSRRGLYPRGFSGEQSYWTVVGVDGGGAHSALISEDGAVEPGMRSFSIEPFLIDEGRLLTWADVAASHTLEDGYLPMPGVTWKTPELTLRTEAFAAGDRAGSRLLMRYSVENNTDRTRNVTLALALRPFQVNPPTQVLNTTGGVSPIHSLAWNGSAVAVNGEPRVLPLQAPDAFVASSFDAGNVVARLEARDYRPISQVSDDFGYASGALLFQMAVPSHGLRTTSLVAPLSGTADPPDAAGKDRAAWAEKERDAVATQWFARLNDVLVQLPEAVQDIANTLRTSLAYILVSRDGPALQPGTRSYARTWIRDGAMMSEALLRLGRSDVVREFITWYAPRQFSSGKVPCCVDARGSDPVPENDSNGEFIFTIAEFYRFSGDRATVDMLWPHVVRAFDYMERLRASERTQANRQPERLAFYGLMPASISHEGYSAKPVHSYWDDFWALRGYEGAVYLARALGRSEEAKRMADARNQFRSDLSASIRTAVKQHHIGYLPGSAELGDFDPTSTTIALSPGNQQLELPKDLLQSSFTRYWRQFLARLANDTHEDAYTPYELRTVAAFTHLGWRDRIQPLLEFFLADRRPPAWNGWAEVVRRNPREPGFIGDMPHAWIASDFIRSVLDMLAYRRDADNAVVLAAGVPAEWLEGEGVGISGLHTPWGRLRYGLHRKGSYLYLHIDADAAPPGGFIFPWPYTGNPKDARINGSAVSWHGTELQINAANAEVIINVE